MGFFSLSDEGIILSVRVQPRAGKNQVVGRMGDALKLKLKAPPVDDKANEAACVFLAEYFRIPRSAVELRKGQHSRAKVFLLKNLSEVSFRNQLGNLSQE